MKTRKLVAQAPVASKAARDGSPPAGSRTVPVQDSSSETAKKRKASRHGPIWKVSIGTTSEAEEAVTELLQEVFNQPASSYTDVETGEVTVAVYLGSPASRRQNL